MKNLWIFGAGGFAREAYCVIKRNNINYHICGFIDIQKSEKKIFNLPIVDISELHNDEAAFVAVGNLKLRKKIVENIKEKFQNIEFPNFIDPSASILDKNSVSMGEGNIVCANCILTCDLKIGNFCQINLSSTIGHDCIVGDYVTTASGVHINGCNKINDNVYFGTNSATKEKITICKDVVIGAGATVVKNIIMSGVYIGIPAELKINYSEL